MVSIGAGINVGPGINIEYYKTPYVDMRSLLSASGQSAYDAATSGDLFAVSQADFETVEAFMADTYTRGAISRPASGSSWSNGFSYIHAPYELICYAGGKIVGMTWKFQTVSSSTTVNLANSTTYNGTYADASGVSSITVPTSGGTTRRWYLRKEAADLASNTFSTVKHSAGGSMESGPASSIGFYASNGVSGWTAFNGGANQTTQFLYVLPSSVGLVTTGLQMNLIANSRVSVLNGSTGTWRDVSGNNNTPTAVISSHTATAFPCFYNLNGSSSYFNCGTNLISSGGSFTKEAWIYRNTAAGFRNIFSTNDARLYVDTSTGNLFGGIGANHTLVSESAGVTNNAWHHVALTWDHATQTMTLYRNGTQVSQATTSGASYIASEPLYFGSQSGASPTYTAVNFWSGRFGEGRIYNRALNSSEISRNYSASRTVMGQ